MSFLFEKDHESKIKTGLDERIVWLIFAGACLGMMWFGCVIADFYMELAH